MKHITTEKEYNEALTQVNELMKKGEDHITESEAKTVVAMAKAIQDYEKIHYPFPMPKNLVEMVELKMLEKKINRTTLAQMLNIGTAKLSQILNRKRKPDVQFLKAIHEKLGLDGNFILKNV